jgi:putative ABC transport system permease protein
MFKTRQRKIAGDILSRKGRTALVSLSIFIGVLGVVTLFSMGDILVSRLKKDIQEDKLAMVKIGLTPAGSGVEAADNAPLLDYVQSQPGVTVAEGQIISQLYFKDPDSEGFEQGTLVAYSVPMDALQIEPLQLVKGSFPAAGSKTLAVERRMADAYHLQVGDTVGLRMVSQAGSGDTIPVEDWTIAAIVFQPYALAEGDVDMASTVFTTLEDAQYISGIQNLTGLSIRYDSFATAQTENTDLTSGISNNTPFTPFFSFLFDPALNDQVNTAESTSTVLGVLGIVALLVSGFLVVNVISSIVVEQKRQIGVMKALGASTWDNVVMYAGIALVYGLLGVIPGVMLGIPLGYLAAQGMAGTMTTIVDKFTFSPSGILIGVAIGLGVPILAAFVPVFNGSRVKILDAMTDLGIDSSYGRGLLPRFINRLPIPATIRQGMSNVIQKRGRLAFTVLTLTIAAGAFMGIFALFSSVGSVLNNTFDTFSIEILIQPDQPQDFDAVSQLIMDNVDGIAAVDRHNGLQIEIAGYDAGTYGVSADGYDPDVKPSPFDLTLSQGVQLSESQDPNALIITSSMAETMGKGVGDTVVVTGAGTTREMTIVGIAKFPFPNVWMRWDTVAEFGGFTLNGQPAARNMLIKLAGADPTAKQTADKIDEINELLLAHGITAAYRNFPEFIDQITTTVRVFQVIFNVTAGLIALVGALGLFMAISMSVFERQKEIGVMRSIGAGSGTIATQFLSDRLAAGMGIGPADQLWPEPTDYFRA